MSLAWATITRCVMWPLMSSPRMSWARALASSGLSASLTPPALPRPPTLTWAFTTTGAAISRAIASACSGVSATPPGSTGTPCAANRSRAWYSKRSTNRHRSSRVTRPPRGALVGRRARGTHHNRRHPSGCPRLRPRSSTTRSSTVRRATSVLVTSLLTAGGVAAFAPSASAADMTPTALKITVTGVGPGGGNCTIDADLYVPPGVTSAHRAPAILTTNGFGGTKADQANIAQGLGEQGYVTLAYTGLGFVDHDTCPITLDDREHDGRAASQLLRFLGGDPRIAAVDQNTGKPVHVDQVIRDDGPTGTRY